MSRERNRSWKLVSNHPGKGLSVGAGETSYKTQIAAPFFAGSEGAETLELRVDGVASEAVMMLRWCRTKLEPSQGCRYLAR